MFAAFATVLVRRLNADVRTFLLAIATATATKRTPSVSAAAIVPPTPTWMASVTTKTIAWVPWMRAAFATAPARFSSADVRTFPQATAIATATKKMLWATVVALAKRTPMPMASATTPTIVLVNMTIAAFATVMAPHANVKTETKMPTAFVTKWTIAWVSTTTVASAMAWTSVSWTNLSSQKSP